MNHNTEPIIFHIFSFILKAFYFLSREKLSALVPDKVCQLKPSNVPVKMLGMVLIG